MKVIITGSNGNLGTKLIDTCLKKGHNPVGLDFAIEPSNSVLGKFKYYWCDIQEKEKLLAILSEVKPDVIIHTAAITDVDLCEQEKELSLNINVNASQYLLEYSKGSNCKFIFISTDYVFDGEKGNYHESDVAEPINFYGKNKLQVEKEIIENLENYLIIRTSCLFAVGPNLTKNFMLWILGRLKANDKVPLFTDQIVNPTLADNLSDNIFELISADANGIFHLTGADSMSRFQFGEILCDIFNYDKGLLEKTSLKDFDFAAKRPFNSSLCIEKFISTCKVKPFGVKESLNFVKVMLQKDQ